MSNPLSSRLNISSSLSFFLSNLMSGYLLSFSTTVSIIFCSLIGLLSLLKCPITSGFTHCVYIHHIVFSYLIDNQQQTHFQPFAVHFYYLKRIFIVFFVKLSNKYIIFYLNKSTF